MFRNQQLTIRSLALAGLATAAMFAPHAASARPVADVHGTLPAKHALVDLRSPDAATPVEIQPTQVDLRSPDAATPVEIQPTRVDLRSPDAATPVEIQPTQVDLRSPDAATPVHTPTAPKISQPHAIGTPAGSDDFDYGSAAVGAGIALLVALACAGSMVAVNRRRSTVSFGS